MPDGHSNTGAERDYCGERFRGMGQDAQRNLRNRTPPHRQDEGQHACCTGG
ncbi:hypothetical protein L6467_03945 [Segatella bryantii]|uniref:hypothetical protein n=1 Tax=Segatella bryantii TaxID=77095 RepID=UPI001EDBF8F1|nr:hypothetical protein [Segatella bryantii]UKK72253.1 hypothetical protein L6467_03945 [Segatella bryantii]